jgi:hypothetical protein
MNKSNKIHKRIIFSLGQQLKASALAWQILQWDPRQHSQERFQSSHQPHLILSSRRTAWLGCCCTEECVSLPHAR